MRALEALQKRGADVFTTAFTSVFFNFLPLSLLAIERFSAMSALLKREADDFTTVLTGVFTTVFYFIFLYIYIANGHFSAVAALLKRGADVRARGLQQETGMRPKLLVYETLSY